MDNCDNSRNMTSTSVGLQSTGLNWCHFSIVDTKKCHSLEKGDRLTLKIKMFPAPAAEKGALLPYPQGTVYAFSSRASNYWEETELFDIEDIVSEYIHMWFEENKAIETSLSGFADLLTQRSLILKCALCSSFLQINLPYQENWVAMEFSFSGF